jgi:hypothetical protein
MILAMDQTILDLPLIITDADILAVRSARLARFANGVAARSTLKNLRQSAILEPADPGIFLAARLVEHDCCREDYYEDHGKDLAGRRILVLWRTGGDCR